MTEMIRRSNGRQLANVCVLGLAAAVATLAIVGVDGPGRIAVTLIAALVVPGWAVMTRLEADDPLTTLGMTVAFSLAIETVCSALLVWTGWWHPYVLAALLGAGSSVLVLIDLRARGSAFAHPPAVLVGARQLRVGGRENPAAANAEPGPLARSPVALAAAIAAIAVGLGLWAFSLRDLDPLDLGPYGLTTELPLEWFAGLAVLLAGAVAVGTATRPRALLVAAYVLAIVVVLYGTVPFLVDDPQYAWTYKHIGVTRFLADAGQVDPDLDIYNRWPAFFALAAGFSEVAGAPNPLAYAQWAELVFMPLGALALAVAVLAVIRDLRVASLTAVFFVSTAWVAQMYFAPQALAFVLALFVIAVCLRHLSTEVAWSARRSRALLARLTRTAQAPFSKPLGEIWPLGLSVGVALLLYAAVVPTHQLTPFILLISVAGLIALGIVAPRWTILAMAALVLGYLALNFEFIRENFSIFTGLDPVENAQQAPYDLAPAEGKEFNTAVARLLPIFGWLGAVIGFARLARLGLGAQALPLAVLALAPFAILLGQSYGGEAALRVILFSAPWCGALIAWGLTTVRRRAVMQALATGVAALFAALFVPAYFGTAQLTVMPPEEVRASEYLYEHGRPGSVVMLAAPDFPARLAPNYPKFVGPQTESEPNLLRTDQFRGRPLGPADVAAVKALMRDYAARGYLVFSQTQYKFTRLFGLTPPGALRNLERAVAAAPEFELFYANPRTRIYELKPGRDGLGG
jgi:hypothetical protein